VGEDVETAALLAERNLYRKLLDLGASDDFEELLKEALALVLQSNGARRGYIELRDAAAPPREPWWIAEGFTESDLGDVRAAISRGVVAEALATGRTILSASALDDPRFRSRESVKSNSIEAVLCAPIGKGAPFGVLYLQDRTDAGPFSEEDRARAEVFARHLAPLAERLVLRHRAQEQNDATRVYRASLTLTGLAGHSEAIARVLRDVALVAPRKVTVLLTGASGTGKTQLARIIHANGPRADKPFVELNCATLPEALIESELFGAEPGAHSTATRRMAGKVAAAERGTLFLDEIAELPVHAQSKLLQLLSSHEYFPLGGSKAVKADVRIIAASNIDLKEAVERRTFREDLYYRLQIVPIVMPLLSARREDIPDLMAFFARRTCDEHDLSLLHFSPGAVHAAESATWPGNIRQLENAVEAAVIRAAGEGASEIDIAHLFPESGLESGERTEERALTFQAATRAFQANLLLRTLEETGWSIAETARKLDLARSHVYNLIRANGLETMVDKEKAE
jgi:Nif-specific regulatory protein